MNKRFNAGIFIVYVLYLERNLDCGPALHLKIEIYAGLSGYLGGDSREQLDPLRLKATDVTRDEMAKADSHLIISIQYYWMQTSAFPDSS